LSVADEEKKLIRRRKKRKERKRYFTSINIIVKILDQFLDFCCSCRCRAISKVIDNKSLATRK